MRILFVTSEIAPWSKTGGLGDVAAALPQALRRTGLDVRVLTPCYPALRKAFPHAHVVARLPSADSHPADAVLRHATGAGGTPLLLLDCPAYYDRPGNPYVDAHHVDWPDNHLRFGLLSRVAAWLGSDGAVPDQRCDVVHCNDWQSGLAPVYLHLDRHARAKTMMTVHNLAFLGAFPHAALQALGLPGSCWQFDGVEFHGKVSFLKAGLQYGDIITTVSPAYAREIATDEGGMGLAPLLRYRRDALVGILNGIDTAEWDPSTDVHIAVNYDIDRLDRKAANGAALRRELGLVANEDVPLLGVVSRFSWQKGLDLLPPILGQLAALPAQIVVLGSGDPELERQFAASANAFAGRVAVRIGFDDALAHRIMAGADIFLMPSRFEPCGLAQMYALRYGTPPVVRRTGGLSDTVIDSGSIENSNGFAFDDATPAAFLDAVARAAHTWRDKTAWETLQRNGMSRDDGWDSAARRYLDLYDRLLGLA